MKSILLLILFLLPAIISSAQIVEAGNIAKYYFNNSNANDDVGINDGVIFGAVLDNDRFDNTEQAFSFDNTFIRIDHDETLDLGSGDFSISAWFKTDNDDTYSVIFNKGEGTAIKPRIFIRTMAEPQSTFQWRVGDGVNNVTVFYTDPSFFDNQWHHVVLVKNANSLSFYLDGNLIDLTTNNQLASINTNSNRPILIGVQDSVYSSSGNVPFGNYFDGSLDDYRIYNRAINDLEVDSLFNEVDPNIVTEVQENLNKVPFKIYPNPSSGNITLDLPVGLIVNRFEIFNSRGMLVSSGLLENEKINLSSLSSGLYFLQLLDDKKVVTVEKFIKTVDK